MTSCHATVFSIKAGSFILMDQVDDNNSANLASYQQLMEMLMYLACGTRLDIFLMVFLLSQYNSDPRIKHFYVAKQVFHHLKETINLRIV